MAKSKEINKAGQEQEAREAVRTLIRWAGDNPDRPGMRETPDRVLAFYRDFFKGYSAVPQDFTSTAEGTACDDFILVRGIAIASFCEHHMLPATGTAHIAYIPGANVPGIGTIARLAAACAARFTTQETLTADIAALLQDAFAPAGAAVMITLSHGCMTLRCEAAKHAQVATVKFTGSFLDNDTVQKQFLYMTQNAKEED